MATRLLIVFDLRDLVFSPCNRPEECFFYWTDLTIPNYLNSLHQQGWEVVIIYCTSPVLTNDGVRERIHRAIQQQFTWVQQQLSFEPRMITYQHYREIDLQPPDGSVMVTSTQSRAKLLGLGFLPLSSVVLPRLEPSYSRSLHGDTDNHFHVGDRDLLLIAGPYRSRGYRGIEALIRIGVACWVNRWCQTLPLQFTMSDLQPYTFTNDDARKRVRYHHTFRHLEHYQPLSSESELQRSRELFDHLEQFVTENPSEPIAIYNTFPDLASIQDLIAWGQKYHRRIRLVWYQIGYGGLHPSIQLATEYKARFTEPTSFPITDTTCV